MNAQPPTFFEPCQHRPQVDGTQKLISRIVETSNELVTGALENKVDELERKKLILAEKAAETAQPLPSF